MTYSAAAEAVNKILPAQTVEDHEREFIISAVRCARLRAQLLVTEIDEVGAALKHNMVSSDAAIGWLRQIGASRFLTPGVQEAFQ